MTFNSKFHQIKPGHKVFSGCVSYIEQYTERLGPNKGKFVLHIALKNDSDIELSSPNQHSRMSYFRNSGLVEILPDLLVNPEAVAQFTDETTPPDSRWRRGVRSKSCAVNPKPAASSVLHRPRRRLQPYPPSR